MRLLIILGLVSAWSNLVGAKAFGSSKNTCGYESCHAVDPNRLNVHLIPHSHDDVGWLKTVDQYYYGSRSYLQFAGVQYIIGSAVEALQKDANRRYIQVETAFFWEWWQNQSNETKAVTQELVNSGRLEIINGAWSMNDEAATNYHSIIDQFTWGLKKITDTLGECGRPKIGWQIDPFGHSNEMASLFSQIGYEAMFFARLDYRDNKTRHDTNNLEMIWRSSSDLGESSNLFTGVLYDFYTAPAYFCWDVLCGDTPMIDNKNSPDYNVDERVDKFAKYVTHGASVYNTNNIMITMGGDFTYQAAEMYFINMDRLIKGFQEYRPDINVIYSTPSCYVKAVNDEANSRNINFQSKTDDFFPYASDPHSYWTGYFTSRPNSKRYERQGNNLLQVVKQLATFDRALNQDFNEDTYLLREVMGIMQHHDAITGTEKQHVVDDYVRLLHKAVTAAESNIDEIVVNILKKQNNAGDVKVDLGSCILSNVSHCDASNVDRFTVAIYNPLSRNVTQEIRLPVDGFEYKITGPGGESDFVVLPTIAHFRYVENINPSSRELVFIAHNLPALGLRYYHVERIFAKAGMAVPIKKKTRLGTDVAGFEVEAETGLLKSVTLNGITLPVRQQFMYYNGANGTNTNAQNRASGAYIFRPANTTPEALPIARGTTYYNVYSTDIVDEVHQVINDWARQIIRVYKNRNYIEFDWLIGPLQFINDLGIEVITRFTTDFQTDGTFYTDSNGRQLLRRIRNFRETYEFTDEEPISGNYYPVTSRIVLKDEARNLELAVLNDRAQGGSSLKDGVLELMVHRRLLNDDAFGVGEALNEVEFGKGVVVRGQHYLTFGSSNVNPDGRSSAAQQRDLAQKKLLAPWTFVGDATSAQHNLENFQEKLNFEFSGLTKSLPENVQILTLESWDDNRVLLRLEHVLQRDEDVNLSQSVTVDLTNLFTLFDITSLEEMNLAANQRVDEIDRLQWNIRPNDTKKKNVDKVENLLVVLNPMEIRTFIASISPKSNSN